MKKLMIYGLAAVGMLFATPTAHAGNGTADFYLSAKCYIDGGPERLSVTNWDTSATSQRYHMDLYAGTAPPGQITSYDHYAIYLDGVKQAGTNDIYKTLSGHGRHTIKGTFRNKVTGALISCSVVV